MCPFDSYDEFSYDRYLDARVDEAFGDGLGEELCDARDCDAAQIDSELHLCAKHILSARLDALQAQIDAIEAPLDEDARDYIFIVNQMDELESAGIAAIEAEYSALEQQARFKRQQARIACL